MNIPQRINLKDYLAYAIRERDEEYVMTLTQDQIDSMNAELVLSVGRIKRIEDEKKAATAKFNAALKEAKNSQTELTRTLESGKLSKLGKIYTLIFKDPESGDYRVGEYNENGQLVSSRAAADSELQMNLYIEAYLLSAHASGEQPYTKGSKVDANAEETSGAEDKSNVTDVDPMDIDIEMDGF